MIEDVAQGKTLTINDKGKYILLELPVQSIPFYIEKVLKELKSKGITGVISHPERNYHVQKNPSVLEKFTSLGVLFQLTAMSLTGSFGESAQETSASLLKKDLAHIIASDAHSKNKRPPILSSAVNKAAEIIGPKKAREMVTIMPSKVLGVSLGK